MPAATPEIECATDISPTICGACKEIGTLRCGGCKNMHYCGSECQRKDWRVHKLLCKSFEQFQDKDRPSPAHHRAIYFPFDEQVPHFIWLCDSNDDTSRPSMTLPYLIRGDRPQENIYINSDWKREVKYSNLIVLWTVQKSRMNSSNTNDALAKTLGPKYVQKLRGDFVARGRKDRANDFSYETLLKMRTRTIDPPKKLDLDTKSLNAILSCLEVRAAGSELDMMVYI
ncbi:hypothetical protein BS50DRAFT_583994 [Corynespora cassiicola Philippines]|uniref:MYND-type domain-containing protein n=1 Tax=Corynespora cassiicola Philippines TaxID=1448308 RepID=A0A2T2P495_CORCC|nr:hypothetical protein BS50DRAFT_583994 [Corynespora cassiicola Philippines]